MLGNLEGYYGATYNPTQRSVIAAWLGEKNPASLPLYYAEILRVGLFGIPLPRIEHFEQVTPAVNDCMADMRKPPARLMIDEDALPKEVIAEKLSELPGHLGWMKNIIGKDLEGDDYRRKEGRHG